MALHMVDENSIEFKTILKIEEDLREVGIKITGAHLRLEIKGKKYRIGKDSDIFPREIDEPFWRDE